VATLLQILVVGMPIGVAYAAVALGFNVIYRSGRVFNIALGEMFALAAFFIMWLLNRGVPAWPAVGITGLLMIAVGLLIQRLALRPLLGQSALSLFMATLGVLLLLNGADTLVLNTPTGTFPQLFGAGAIRLPYAVQLPVASVVGVAVVVIIVLGFVAFFSRTQTGIAMTAVAEDHEVAQSLGINIERSLALSWAMCGLLSTVAAVVYLAGQQVTSDIGSVAFLALPVVLLGGLESIGGVILAGLVVGLGQTSAAEWLDPHFHGGASEVFPYLLMLLILLVRPEGFFGWKRVERV